MLASALAVAASPTSSPTSSLPSSSTQYLQPPPRPYPSHSGPSSLPSYGVSPPPPPLPPRPPQPPRRSNSNPGAGGREGNSSLLQADLQRTLQSFIRMSRFWARVATPPPPFPSLPRSPPSPPPMRRQSRRQRYLIQVHATTCNQHPPFP